MSNPYSPLQLFQFLDNLEDSQLDRSIFESFLISLRTPRFAPVSTITARYNEAFSAQAPTFLSQFQQLIYFAEQSPEYDQLIIQIVEHYRLIRLVSCFLEDDLQQELFIQCICLDNSGSLKSNKQVIKQNLIRFLDTVNDDMRESVERIIIGDQHGYLTMEDCAISSMTRREQLLNLDRVYEILDDPTMFDQFMAIIQANTARGVSWQETVQEIYELVAEKNVWNQLSPLLQQAYGQQGADQYESYEDYVQKNFLDNGGQQYLDGEIDRAQVEHMFGNLTM